VLSGLRDDKFRLTYSLTRRPTWLVTTEANRWCTRSNVNISLLNPPPLVERLTTRRYYTSSVSVTSPNFSSDRFSGDGFSSSPSSSPSPTSSFSHSSPPGCKLCLQHRVVLYLRKCWQRADRTYSIVNRQISTYINHMQLIMYLIFNFVIKNINCWHRYCR